MTPHLSERALIFAPIGRDAVIAASILSDSGLQSKICPTLRELVIELESGSGFAVLTEEGLHTANLNPLAQWLNGQPEWSDFPFVLLTHKGGGLERNPAAKRFLDMLGNVTFLERPFHPTTLVSLAQSALRGRRRQYDARARLEDLHQGAAKYRSLFESIDAGFCIIEMVFDAANRPVDYRFIETNPAFVRQTGLENAIGKTIRSMVPAHEQIWFDMFGAVARTGEHARFEEHAEALGDYWYDVYAFCVGDSGDTRVAVLFTDISDRRRMEVALRESEEGLRRLNETLEERVEERTRALEVAQEALRQSHKLESMGQLTGGVAHDFNNLLTPIVASLDLLHRRGVGSERERRLIEGAMQSADRARTLVQRLLAFARRQPLQARPVDIGKVVMGIEGLLASTCGPRISLEIQIEPELPPAKADANQIEMALLNLAVNARDAMPDGGALSIDASLETITSARIDAPFLPHGRFIRLSVVDSGSGMDPETLAKAIEPFFTTKEVGLGTGLGLSMVHGLAAQLGGGLGIRSELAQGTAIDLWLPVTDEAVISDLGAEQVEFSSNRQGTAVIVDDEDLVRASTAHMLGEIGYDVVEARSAQEALRIIDEAGPIALLVTDHLMPGMNGTELAMKVRESHPAIRVLLISGYAESRGVSSTIPCLTKPFRQRDLAQVLAKL